MMSKSKRKILGSYEDYIFQDSDIQVYEKSKRLASLIELPGIVAVYGLIVSSALLLVNVASYPRYYLANESKYLYFLQTPLAPPSEFAKFGAVFALCLIAALFFIRMEYKFQRKAYSTDINQQKYRLNILARAISALRNEDHEGAVSQLKKFNELEREHIPNTMAAQIDTYIYKIDQNQDTEHLEQTFEDFVGVLMEEIMIDEDRREEELEAIIEPGGSEYLINDTPPQEETPVTYMGIIREIISSYELMSFKPNFWLLYIIAAGFGIFAFMFVDKTLGIISVTILLTGLQIYDRREKRKEENE